jgi:hypothetical protein
MESDIAADITARVGELSPMAEKIGARSIAAEAGESEWSDDVDEAVKLTLCDGADDPDVLGLKTIQVGGKAAGQLDSAAITPGMRERMRNCGKGSFPGSTILNRNERVGMQKR